MAKSRKASQKKYLGHYGTWPGWQFNAQRALTGTHNDRSRKVSRAQDSDPARVRRGSSESHATASTPTSHVWYDSSSGKLPKAWLRDMFSAINNGRVQISHCRAESRLSFRKDFCRPTTSRCDSSTPRVSTETRREKTLKCISTIRILSRYFARRSTMPPLRRQGFCLSERRMPAYYFDRERSVAGAAAPQRRLQ